MRVVVQPMQREITKQSGACRPLRRAGICHISYAVFFAAEARFEPRDTDRHRRV